MCLGLLYVRQSEDTLRNPTLGQQDSQSAEAVTWGSRTPAGSLIPTWPPNKMPWILLPTRLRHLAVTLSVPFRGCRAGAREEPASWMCWWCILEVSRDMKEVPLELPRALSPQMVGEQRGGWVEMLRYSWSSLAHLPREAEKPFPNSQWNNTCSESPTTDPTAKRKHPQWGHQEYEPPFLPESHRASFSIHTARDGLPDRLQVLQL